MLVREAVSDVKILEIKSTLRFNRYSQLILTGTLAKQIETIYN